MSTEKPFLDRLLEIIADTVGGLEEQHANQIAKQIAIEYGGREIKPTSPSTLKKRERDQAIIVGVRDRGMSKSAAAQHFGVSRQYVYWLLMRTPSVGGEAD